MATITKTIGTNSRDYSTITLWEADFDNGAIYSAGDDAVGECYDDSVFDEEVVINGGQALLNSVLLTVPESERHNGLAGTGARIVRSASTGSVVTVDGKWTGGIIVEWLEIDANGQMTQFARGYFSTTNANTSDRTKTIVRNLIVHGCYGNRFNRGIDAGQRPLTVLNCIVYRVGDNGSVVGAGTVFGIGGDDKVDVYNCTVHDVRYNDSTTTVYAFGYLVTAESNYRNCIATGTDNASGTGEDFQTGVTYGTATNNASSDATAPGTSAKLNIVTADQFVNTTIGSEDLHLKADSDAIDAGVDLGTTAGVNIDINGYDRDSAGVVWDMGAHEYIQPRILQIPANRYNPKIVTGDNYTILDCDFYSDIDFETGSGSYTCTLPTLGNNIGRQLRISKIDSGIGTVSVDCKGADCFLDGTTSKTLSSQGDTLVVIGTANGWKII